MMVKLRYYNLRITSANQDAMRWHYAGRKTQHLRITGDNIFMVIAALYSITCWKKARYEQYI